MGVFGESDGLPKKTGRMAVQRDVHVLGRISDDTKSHDQSPRKTLL